ncbi:MAG: 50S ribosomal protein L3 N(5)-glutamine methyltransferase [Limnohabitans sp.]|jgi:ribosomal protein L3 glutamine methyltransferase
MTSPKRLSALIEDCATQLEDAHLHAGLSFGHGTNNAQDEAAWLVLWQLGLPLDTDFTDDAQDVLVREAELIKVQHLIAQRITTRKPAAYLTQEAWLEGVSFYVDERVIVPRSLIAEVLASGNIDPWLSADTKHLLDMCTGNGSLAILAALAYPEVQVIGSDVSAEALEVAHINMERHALQERLTWLQSDGFKNIQHKFDLILCNPPYVNSQSMATLPQEYVNEPALALDGGPDGMRFISRLLHEAPNYMQENAILVLEIGNEREHFEAAFPKIDVVWLTTSAGDDQVLLLTRQAIILNNTHT